MRMVFAPATAEDADEIAALRTAVADRLTLDYGKGHWSSAVSAKGVCSALRASKVFAARRNGRLVATVRLATKKPWAIDKTYFTNVRTALYLLDMAVDPGLQRQGIGRTCLAEAGRIARDWPGDAIRLDAYDAGAGAGPFYAKCGYQEVGRATYRKTPLIYYELLL